MEIQFQVILLNRRYWVLVFLIKYVMQNFRVMMHMIMMMIMMMVKIKMGFRNQVFKDVYSICYRLDK